MKPEIQPNKIVVLSGSGLSAESGLPTFRDSNGLWNEFSWQEVASPEGWKARPEAVLAFYNERRAKASQALPNAAHEAIAALEAAYDVVVLTQNVDELHELAGSTKVGGGRDRAVSLLHVPGRPDSGPTNCRRGRGCCTSTGSAYKMQLTDMC